MLSELLKYFLLLSDVIDIPKTHSDAYWFVLDAGSKGCIKFGCKTHAEREGWVKGLFRVTGQSNKPSDEIDGSTGMYLGVHQKLSSDIRDRSMLF